MTKEFRARTLESVHSVDDPDGISWLTGVSLTMDPEYQGFQDEGSHCDDCNRYGVFPVSTDELRKAKQAKMGGGVVRQGDFFAVDLNLDATSPADINPVVEAYCVPIPDEQLAELFNESKD